MTEERKNITPTPIEKVPRGKRRKITNNTADTSRLSNLIHAVKREHIIKALSADDVSRFAGTSSKHASETKEILLQQQQCKEMLQEYKDDLYRASSALYIGEYRAGAAEVFIRRVLSLQCPLAFNRVAFMNSIFDEVYLSLTLEFQELATLQDWKDLLEISTSGVILESALKSHLREAEKIRLLSLYLDTFIEYLVAYNEDQEAIDILNFARKYLQALSNDDKKLILPYAESATAQVYKITRRSPLFGRATYYLLFVVQLMMILCTKLY